MNFIAKISLTMHTSTVINYEYQISETEFVFHPVFVFALNSELF